MTLLSTYKPVLGRNFFVVSGDECSSFGVSDPGTLVCLTVEDTLCLLGNCKLIVLCGSLDTCGTVIAASENVHRVFAPRCSPLPVLKVGQGQNFVSFLDDETVPDRFRAIFGFSTVVMLQSLETDVEGLGKICRPFEGVFGPLRAHADITSAALGVPGLHMVLNSAKEFHTFSVPSTWSTALDAVISIEQQKVLNPDLPGIYIVKGAKNYGKSTFARTLLNRLLSVYSRVGFLECDIGQPEFTPPGLVSLTVISHRIFGPPFTHPTLPNYAHFIGAPTARSSPSYYIDAISALIESYRRDIQIPEPRMVSHGTTTKIDDYIPLVVNTMGWNKGLGADVNRQIEAILQPTDVFHIYDLSSHSDVIVETSRVSENLGIYAPSGSNFRESVSRIHALELASSASPTTITAADHRHITILSYFHAVFPRQTIPGPLEQVTAKLWDSYRPLCVMPPFEVDCSKVVDKIILTGPGSEDVVEEEVLRVLNGAVVGLVCESDSAYHNTDSKGLPYTRGCEPPSPYSSNCVGLAVVRALSSFNMSPTSSTTTYLQLLTPIPHFLLSHARVIVKGELDLPIWAMFDFRIPETNIKRLTGVEFDTFPYLQWGKIPGGVLGAEKKKIRRNILRRGQL